MHNLENPFAGQGPVLLDIGGDIGALVVAMPADTEGLEVEIRPAGTTASHGHDVAHHPHVGVVARPGPDGPAHSLVYPEVTEGSYELVPIPGDTVVLAAEVTGGVVTYTSWPTDGPRT